VAKDAEGEDNASVFIVVLEALGPAGPFTTLLYGRGWGGVHSLLVPDGGVEDAVILGVLQGVGQVLALAGARPDRGGMGASELNQSCGGGLGGPGGPWGPQIQFRKRKVGGGGACGAVHCIRRRDEGGRANHGE
jgi:hypothetical protein